MREKDITKLMPKMYRWNTYNTSMFFSIKTQLMFFPTLTIDQAISNYYKLIGIDEGEWDRMAIRVQYNRMIHEFYGKSECTKKNKGTARPEAGSDK
jgi:hypothetical protein